MSIQENKGMIKEKEKLYAYQLIDFNNILIFPQGQDLFPLLGHGPQLDL